MACREQSGRWNILGWTMLRNLTPEQIAALKRIPLSDGSEPIDIGVVEELMGLGLIEQRLDGLALTQRGAIVKVQDRASH